MKKLLSFVLTLAIVICAVPLGAFTLDVSAETQYTDGYYTYTVEGGEATITRVDTSISGAKTIPSTLGGYPVTSIGYRAFNSCESLTSIAIPDCVTSIGGNAFSYCNRLTSVTIGSGLTSMGETIFDGCEKLTSITVNSNNVNYCSVNGVLYNKDKTMLIWYPAAKTATSFTIPNSVKSIGIGAFWHSTSLTNITIPNGVANIGEAAFYYCTGLTNIIIPDSVTSIGSRAFYNCTSLASASIGNGVTSIGYSAFYNCTWIKSLSMGNRVASIGEYAFYSCYNIKSITIPESVMSIGNQAFYKCNNIASVYITDIAAWCNIDFGDEYSNPLVYSDSLTGICNLYLNGNLITKLVIPDSVTSIGDYAFYSCANLTSITIPDSVISIGSYAFHYCYRLTSITIPDSVTSIGNSAFTSCYYLTSITIPDSVMSIGNAAFDGCRSLASVTIPDSVTSIGVGVFYNCSKLTEIIVNENNNDYCSVSGVLFNKDKTTLIQYPQEKINASYIILNSVTSICDYAFYNCTELTSVTIPDSVTSIGYRAFYGCGSLNAVYYNGSIIDKEKISIGSYNNGLDNATWYYSKCTTTSEHIYDNACDTNCNVCNAVRIVPNHIFDNACDTTCNICGVIIRVPEHVYDNTCDTTCNVCNEIRTITHTYSNNCDNECNICGNIRIPDVHKVMVIKNTLTFENSATYPFTYSNGTYTSTNKSHNSISSFVITALYDCDLTLQYSVSSESNYDKLIIYKNSTALDTISGTVSNKTKTISLKAGDTVKITYSKDGSQSSGSDKGSFKITSEYNVLEFVPADTVEHLCDEEVICDVCGVVAIESQEHSYDDTCDTSCNECDAERDITHTYSNNCDNECNVCGFNRIPSDHIYDNTCDTICNECGDIRSITHTYSNECDRDCNVCGEFRKAPHKFDNACDDECNLCGSQREVGPHQYDNVCDTTCNECGAVRSVPDHIYDNACDTNCNICGAVRNVPDHVYTNACDTSCNICGVVRTVGDHVYTNTCDTTCNICDLVRTITHTHLNECSQICDICGDVREPVAEHIYTNTCDTECNECSEIRTIEHTYGNSCDIDCNVCGFIRSIEHTYSDICDGECNVCFETRKAPHKYENDCDAVCNLCGKERTIEHVYVWIIDRQGNCGFDGIKHEKCTLCDAKRSENTVIKATNNHTYDNTCDTVCNVCGIKRTITHTYAGENDLVCDVCFDSLKPNAPTVQEIMATSITLNAVPNCEYSIDGINWQSSVQFSALTPETEYTFYQRVKETSTSKQSATSEALKVITAKAYTIYLNYNYNDYITEIIKTHGIDVNLDTPSRAGHKFLGWSKTPNGEDLCSIFSEDRSITLYAKWSKNCSSCSGTGMIKHVSYENKSCGACGGDGKIIVSYGDFKCKSCGSYDIYEESVPTSNGGWGTRRYCGKCGSENLTREDKTSSCGYCNGLGYTQKENVSYSECTSCNGSCTQMAPQPKAPKPQVVAMADNNIELVEIYGVEYSIDGINWQQNPVFWNLERGITYYIYQRYMATSINTVGEASEPLIIEIHQHKFDNDCDTTCNVCEYIRDITHNYESVVTESTCTEQGYTTHTCDVCGDNYVDSYVNANGHEYDNGCDTTCNNCDYTRDTNHSYDDDFDAVCNECNYERDAKKHGDASGDGVINAKDCAQLIQFINGWNIDIDTAAADVNGDGKINNKDYVLLMRYINGWDVELQ